MGWENCHLHEFEIAGKRYGDPSSMDEVEDEANYRLSCTIKSGIKKFRYNYDFGDDWSHSIVVEGLEPEIADVQYPKCVAGKRACPPEDCGGVWGYGELLQILATPDHPEREERLGWLDREIDPAAFSLEATEQALRAHFPAKGKPRLQIG